MSGEPKPGMNLTAPPRESWSPQSRDLEGGQCGQVGVGAPGLGSRGGEEVSAPLFQAGWEGGTRLAPWAHFSGYCRLVGPFPCAGNRVLLAGGVTRPGSPWAEQQRARSWRQQSPPGGWASCHGASLGSASLHLSLLRDLSTARRREHGAQRAHLDGRSEGIGTLGPSLPHTSRAPRGRSRIWVQGPAAGPSFLPEGTSGGWEEALPCFRT